MRKSPFGPLMVLVLGVVVVACSATQQETSPAEIEGTRGGADEDERAVAAEPSGSMDREVVQRVVREHRREIRACYERELLRDPELEGRVEMAWVILPDGSVSEPRVVSSTLNSSAVEECMAERIGLWQFPEPPGGGLVNVVYPYTLETTE